ncbi:MAG: TIGR03118 family protein [Opitutus sp.]
MNAFLLSSAHRRPAVSSTSARQQNRVSRIPLLIGSLVLPFVAATSHAVQPVSHQYQQTNLVSDVPGLAPVTDPNLVNPWGLARSATSPWWTANNGTGTSSLYNGLGAKLALLVTVPTAPGGTPPSAPTGIVANATSDFKVGPNQPARFIFATEDGTISGWNPAANLTNAILKVNRSGWAVYKGLAIGQFGGANYLYAANFLGGTVEVFNSNYDPVSFGPDAFRDWTLPAGFAPFNVQAIGDRIYVAYAKRDAEGIDEVAGHGNGYVNAYSMNGVLQLRLHSGYWMNAPWGLALAPANFGRFSNLLLVGQFGSGQIAAFDPANGHFRGLLRGQPSRALNIDGLWALSFGNGANAGPVNTLYFTAGPEDEVHGLFGTITPVAPKDNGHDDEDALDDDQ